LAFDLWQQIVLLVAGDKAGDRCGWYREAIPRAEQLYAEHVDAMGNGGTGDRWCAADSGSVGSEDRPSRTRAPSRLYFLAERGHDELESRVPALRRAS
jgi:hypothetical protein